MRGSQIGSLFSSSKKGLLKSGRIIIGKRNVLSFQRKLQQKFQLYRYTVCREGGDIIKYEPSCIIL
jgi:hypothetical protein